MDIYNQLVLVNEAGRILTHTTGWSGIDAFYELKKLRQRTGWNVSETTSGCDGIVLLKAFIQHPSNFGKGWSHVGQITLRRANTFDDMKQFVSW